MCDHFTINLPGANSSNVRGVSWTLSTGRSDSFNGSIYVLEIHSRPWFSDGFFWFTGIIKEKNIWQIIWETIVNEKYRQSFVLYAKGRL